MGHLKQKFADARNAIATDSKSYMLSFWLYFLAIALAELLTIYLNLWIGLVCYGIILVTFIIQPVFVEESKKSDLLLGLSLIPIIRIISLALPLIQLPQIYWFPLIYIPLLASTIVLMKSLKIKPGQVGFTKRGLPLQISLGIITGLAFGILEYLILKPEPMIASLTLEQLWLPAVILITTTGFVEELIFRGVLQRLAEAAMGLWGIIYVSLIFAILHVGFFSTLDVFFVFFIALFFAAIVKKTGSLIGVILSHGVANSILFLVAPFVLN